MKVNCPSCQLEINLTVSSLPPGGMELRCARCLHRFQVDSSTPQGTSSAPIAPATPVTPIAPAPPSEAPAPQEEGALDALADFYKEIEDLTAEVPDEEEVTYQVKRLSGKVFGPFPASTIQQMIDTGQLTGQEQLSPGGDFWSPMVDWPEFREQLLSQQAEADIEEAAAPPPLPRAATRAEVPRPTSVPSSSAPAAPTPRQRPTGPDLGFSVKAAPARPKSEKKKSAPPPAEDDDGNFESSIFSGSQDEVGAAPIALSMRYNKYGDDEEEEEQGDDGLQRPQVDRRKKRIRSALKEEVLEEQKVSADKKNKNLLLFGAVGGLLALLGVAYSMFFAGGGNKKPDAPSNLQLPYRSAFALDTYIRYTKQLQPRARRLVRQYPSSTKAKTLQALVVAMKLEHYGSRKALRNQLQPLLSQIPPYNKDKEKRRSRERLLVRAMVGLAKKKPGVAMRWAKQLLQRDRRDPEAKYIKAKSLYLRRKYKQSLRVLAQLLKQRSQHARAFYIKGRCFQALKQWDKAFNAYHEATLVTENHTPSLLALFALEDKVPVQKRRYQNLWSMAEKAFNRMGMPRVSANFYWMRAKRARKQGNARKALDWLKAALRKNPSSQPLRNQLPKHYFLTRDYEKTYKALNKLITRTKSQQVAEYFLRTLYRQKRYTESRFWFKMLTKRHPRSCKIWYIRGMFEEKLSQAQRAIESYQKCVVLKKQHVAALYGQARVAWRLKKPAVTQTLLERAAKQKVKTMDVDILLSHATLLREMKQNKKARVLLLKTLGIVPRDEVVHLLLGHTYMASQELAKATHHYQQARQIRPQDAESLRSLALSLEQQGKQDKARGYYAQYLKSKPKDDKVLFLLGRLDYFLKNYKSAKDKLMASIKENDQRATAHYYLGRTYEALNEKDNKKLQKTYRNAVRIDPKNRRYLYRLARSYYKNREIRKSLAIFNRMLSASGQTRSQKAEVYFDRGKLFFEMQSWNRAKRDFLYVSKLDRNHKQIARWLGDVYREKNQARQSIRWYRKSLRQIKEPKEKALVYGKLGDLYREKNQPNQALRFYRLAARQDTGAFIYYKHIGYIQKDKKQWNSCIRNLRLFLRKAPANHSDRREVGYDLRSCKQAQRMR